LILWASFASCVFWIVYGARCAHSPYLLRTEGESLLAEATS
jgi:hypothetical protein